MHMEIIDMGVSHPAQGHLGAEGEPVWPSDRIDAVFALQFDNRGGIASVSKPKRKMEPHCHVPTAALDPADDSGMFLPNRHRIDKSDASFACFSKTVSKTSVSPR
jgi:hypothetical protein